MKRMMNKLMIAAAMLAAAAGSAPARTTKADYRTTPDFKTLAAIPSADTDEQQLDEKARTFEKLDVPSRKPSQAPVILMAPGGGCPGCKQGFYHSPWQQIQLYISVFAWL